MVKGVLYDGDNSVYGVGCKPLARLYVAFYGKVGSKFLQDERRKLGKFHFAELSRNVVRHYFRISDVCLLL